MTINCKGKLLDFEKPKIMGILNMTPDSFYDGGSYKTDKKALVQVEKMLKDGADFIDIGGQSTRPSSKMLSAEEEVQRILPIIEMVLNEFPDCLISVDTFYSQVAKETVERGVAMINDISAGNLDANMLKTIAELQVPYIMMHIRGTPQNMQSEEHTTYQNLIGEIMFYFSEKIRKARDLGIHDLIVDVGFGFSKTPKQNLDLIKNLTDFSNLDCPILMGVSRKSTICKILETTPNQALNGTTVLHTLSLLNGANILRVHDVKEAKECIELINAYNN